MKRTGSAVWKGDLKTGTGTISTESGVLDAAPYGFNKRFGEEKGSNPEELIGAAHASCFSMALSKELGEAGMTADEIRTSAAVSLEKVDERALPSPRSTSPCARASPAPTATPS
ncbi:hypothetical protein BH23PSE1_BH23PSE1_14400 [soil metagenome]